ncbi:MAG: type 4a pilus biogenesis protein PilO [Actinomycetota bacterium]
MKEHKQIILSSVGVVLVMTLMFFFLINPRKGDLAEARENVDAAQAETVVLEGELSRLEGLQARAPQLQAALDEIRDLVPDENRVSSFVFQLQQEANRAGLEFVSITPTLPKSPPEGAPLGEVKIDIGAQGTYFTIQDFIRRVTELDRAVRLDGFSMSAVQEEDSEEALIDLLASARIFFEQPAGGAGAATSSDTTATTAPAPAAGGETAPAPSESPTTTPAP